LNSGGNPPLRKALQVGVQVFSGIVNDPAKVWPPMREKDPLGEKYNQLMQGHYRLDAAHNDAFITNLLMMESVVILDEADKAHVRAQVVKMADACVQAKKSKTN